MTRDLWKEAREMADKYAPIPATDPIQAGIAGAFIVGISIALFAALARVDIEHSNTIPMLICIAIGFAAPFLYFKSFERKNSKLMMQEYDRLQAEERRRSSQAV